MTPIEQAIEAPTDDELNRIAQEHTWFNGSHAMTNYPAFARAVLERYATPPPAEPPKALILGKGLTRDETEHGEEYFTRAMVEGAMGKVERLSEAEIAHQWEINVGEPTQKYPFTQADWINFARAIESEVLRRGGGV